MAKETNEQRIARKEIKAAIEGLLTTCRRNHASFLGYVFGLDPPIILRFGNVSEMDTPAFTALILKLDEIMNDGERLKINDPLTEPN